MAKGIPQRTCIGCREVKVKFELMRIVSTPEGKVEIDPRGKRSGRGAYLCHFRDCWQKAITGKNLSYALKRDVSLETLQLLREFAQTLPQRF